MNYIITGRFQPLHLGHLALFENVKTEFPNDLLIICIVRKSTSFAIPKEDSVFFRESISVHDKLNNPLPNWERFILLKTAIYSNDILRNNTVILFRDRPDIDWNKSIEDLPSERCFVFPKHKKTKFDELKIDLYKKMKEDFIEIDNSYDYISSTMIRNDLRNGIYDFNFLPNCCVEYFREYCLKYFDV